MLWFVSMSFADARARRLLVAVGLLLLADAGRRRLGWLCAFHAAKARWIILPRRTLELIGAAAPIFILLFIPVLVWTKQLYPWMHIDPCPKRARRPSACSRTATCS